MTQGTLYYICYLPPKTGGELVNLQHVAALHRQGVRAVALVNPQADAVGLPEGLSLPIEPLAPNRRFQPEDVVVLPEYYRDAFRHFATQPCRRVIHVQGPFLFYRGHDSIEAMNASGFLGGLACSDFTRSLLQRMGSTLAWQVVTPHVLPIFRPGGQKRLQVACMPDKRPRDAPVVQALFRARHPEFRDVPWVPIVGLSRQACAEVMASSAVFASFSWLEGLGLPPLEAMASGCLVCGFDGHGGRDYATPDNGLWVAEGDHEGFADAVAASLRLARAGDAAAAARVAAGHQTAGRYHPERFERELLEAWRAVLKHEWPDFCHPTQP